MHFDQFNAIQKETFHSFTTPFTALPDHGHFQMKKKKKLKRQKLFKNVLVLPHLQHCLTVHYFKWKKKTVKRQKPFKNLLVYDCRPNTHLPNPKNRFSVTAHAQFILENYWLLALGVSFNVLFLIIECPPPPPRDPKCPFVKKYFSPIHTTYQSGILGQGGGGKGGQGQQSKAKMKISLIVYGKKDFRLFSKHQLYKYIYSWL